MRDASVLALMLRFVGVTGRLDLLMTFAALRLLDLLFCDVRRFAISGAARRLRSGGMAVGGGVARREGHIDGLVDLAVLVGLGAFHDLSPPSLGFSSVNTRQASRVPERTGRPWPANEMSGATGAHRSFEAPREEGGSL